MKLVLTSGAERDVLRLYDFLEPKDPHAARDAIRTIRKGARLLEDHPKIGKRIENTEYRELIVPFGRNAYILSYRIEKETVLVTRIWHSREDRRRGT